METTNIEWCDSTFNPWEGCQKVGPGCDHCYAETRNARFAGGTAINWGPGAPRRRTSASNWNKPLAWERAHAEFFAEHGRRQRVFCASLADVFDNAVDPQWRADLFELIEKTPHLDWLLLTKRIGNVANMLPVPFDFDVLFPHVLIGATITSHEEMLRDAPKLKAVGARLTFWSAEPLLGEIGAIPPEYMPDWIIAGGESGHGARPMHPDWVRSLRDQCASAGVPFLFKQWGEWRPAASVSEATVYPTIVTNRAHAAETDVARKHRPSSGCFHMSHQVESMLDGHGQYAHLDCAVFKAGKKAAGRQLDGVTHDGYPAAAP